MNEPDSLTLINSKENKLIFNFLNSTDNTQLTTLSSRDLLQLISLLKKYYLSYRQQLGVNTTDTYGVEIELQKKYFYHTLKTKNIYMEIKDLTGQKDWDVKIDGSLLKHGIEASSPILTNTSNTWQQLEITCQYLNKIGYIDETCGGHIHVGAHILSKNFQAWDSFIKLWIIYEDIILRFVCGEYLRLRTGISTWAYPLSTEMYNSYWCCQKKYQHNFNEASLKHFYYLLGNTRQAINFNNINNLEQCKAKNTIEFRCPNGTLNPIIWQNNINLFLNMLNAVKTSTFNQELLNERFSNLPIPPRQLYIPGNYQTINLDLALEFCDLVFNNNLDKINFLKQYLKNLTPESKRYKKGPSLTKKLRKH